MALTASPNKTKRRRETFSLAKPIWIQIEPSVWVASLGVTHLGRVDLTGGRFRAIDNEDRRLGSFASLESAQEHVEKRMLARLEWAIAGDRVVLSTAGFAKSRPGFSTAAKLIVALSTTGFAFAGALALFATTR